MLRSFLPAALPFVPSYTGNTFRTRTVHPAMVARLVASTPARHSRYSQGSFPVRAKCAVLQRRVRLLVMPPAVLQRIGCAPLGCSPRYGVVPAVSSLHRAPRHPPSL